MFPTSDLTLVLLDYDDAKAKAVRAAARDLMYPLDSEMDLSITVVLKLATIGEGYNYLTREPVKLRSRAVLSGLGADEYFAGYSRYRIAFIRGGYTEMQQEMEFDQKRMWLRNLARDDRAIASEGRELRTPFLTKKITDWAQKLPLQLLASFGSKPTQTKIWKTKKILRKVSKQCGLKLATTLPKKAIQFGTGIAKEHNKLSYGSNRKAKGQFKAIE